ncbi:MAG: response regulator, partial [Lachnospiraceae bacterium]|nr:response regulator [Lachnospiraceae bacterium]
MLKVMLVDDEPFILQGLEVIIDWKAEGFEIVKKAVNGKDALQYLEEHDVDLVITDIRMPEMNGLELLEAIRDQLQKNCYLIILSGYSDFKYAKAAIQYECVDYLLKPVQKDTLLECLRTVMDKNQVYVVENRKTEQLERSYLDQNILSLLRGKWEKVNLDYVKKHLNLQGEIRYIHITMDHLALIEELTD